MLPGSHGSVGLVAACGGVARVRADWSVPADGLAGLEGALFVGTDRTALFDGTAHAVDLAGGTAILDGIADGVDLSVGLGLRVAAAGGASVWTQSGPLLRVRTGPPVYVNPALAPDAGDGTTPQTAFGDLALGMLIANAQGGGSVWVSEGTVANAAIPLFEGVHMCGGFGADFALGRRDPDETPTVLVGVPGQAITTVTSGASGPAVIDGFALIGTADVPAALDDTGRRLEMRSLRISGCQRGIKLRNAPTGPLVEVVVSGVSASGAELEGLSIDGAFELWLEACAFDANGSEGLDLNHLWAPSGATARLVVRGSSFRSNGNEGLDCHLGAPPGPTSPGGDFDVRIQDCDFEGNGFDGLRRPSTPGSSEHRSRSHRVAIPRCRPSSSRRWRPHRPGAAPSPRRRPSPSRSSAASPIPLPSRPPWSRSVRAARSSRSCPASSPAHSRSRRRPADG